MNDLCSEEREALPVSPSLSKNGGHVWTGIAGIRTHRPLPPSDVHKSPDPGKCSCRRRDKEVHQRAVISHLAAASYSSTS